MTAITLPTRIAELIEQHGSLRAAARVLDVDAGYLSRLQSGEKNDPGETLLRRMGLVQQVTYTRKDYRTAPTSAAGATKPNELTSSPEPAPALRAAEWVDGTMKRITALRSMRAGVYVAALDNLRAHLSRASGLLPVAREGLSDEQIKERCKAVGIQWIEPMLDDEGDGYPGGFDMTSMEEMRALLAPASGDAPGEANG